MLDTKSPPQPPKKPTFLKNLKFQENFMSYKKVGFLGGQRGVRDPQTPQMVLKYIGEGGFKIFLVEKGPFQ